MRRTPLASSVLRSVGYDADTAMLELEFLDGDVYRYFAVPARVHAALVDAESPGRFFSDHIRERYPYEIAAD